MLANSGDLRSCSTRASKSNVAGAGSFGSSGDRTQVRIGIEGTLKLLGVDLAVLVQNVRIHAGDHVDLSVARITLGGLQVAVVQL